MRALDPRPSRQIVLAYAFTVAAVLAILFGGNFHRGTGLTSLIRFGYHAKLAPELSGVPVYTGGGHHGYDGRYYVHLALHPPWLYHDLTDDYDAPAYRARRIFLPALAYVLGWGNPRWVVQIYAGLNVIAWLALAGLLTTMLPPISPENYGRWAGCLLSAGALESMRGSLTDLPACLLAMIALRLYESRRQAASAGCFALSILTRETLLLGALTTLWPARFGRRDLVRTLRLAFVMLFPAAAWFLYVAHYFPGRNGNPENLAWPFVALVQGAWDACRHLARGDQDNGRYLFRLLTVFAFAFQIGVVLTGYARSSVWFNFALPFLVLFPFLGPAVWIGPWAVWRTELPVTLAFCFLLPTRRWFWPLLAVGSIPSLHAIFRLAF